MTEGALALVGSLLLAWCMGLALGLTIRLIRWIHDVI